MKSIKIDYEILYLELMRRVAGINYSAGDATNKLNAHQTVNLIIYQVQLILGEVMQSDRSAFWSRLLHRYKDLYWSYRGANEMERCPAHVRSAPDPLFFDRDKKVLILKIKKFFVQPEKKILINHPWYGILSKEQSALLIFRIVDYYLRPLELIQQ